MKNAAVLLLLMSALPLACGPDNIKACEEYVDKVNGEYEECEVSEGTLDKDTSCPDTLNESGAPDCTEYYGCLGDSYTCNEDGTVTSDGASCPGCVA
jgi:hypothetical protein